jgi:hypothetical protein
MGAALKRPVQQTFAENWPRRHTLVSGIKQMNSLTPSSDGFDLLSTTSILIIGLYVKFLHRRYVVGREQGDITNNVVCAFGVKQAWQLWDDNKVVNQLVQTHGKHFPQHIDELPDSNGGKWQSETCSRCQF